MARLFLAVKPALGIGILPVRRLSSANAAASTFDPFAGNLNQSLGKIAVEAVLLLASRLVALAQDSAKVIDRDQIAEAGDRCRDNAAVDQRGCRRMNLIVAKF